MNFAADILQQEAKQGFRRLQNFRAARLLFIKAFAGQYYDRDHGDLGEEPLNLAFTAVRALVPNIVSRNPVPVVGSDYLMYREYGKLLGMGIEYVSKKMNLPKILQRGLIDAIFTMGIFRVCLVSSNSLVYFGEEEVDPGTLEVSTVSFDDYTFDPSAKSLDRPAFEGEKMRVERDDILESGLYDNSIIEKLPSSLDRALGNTGGVRELSRGHMDRHLTKRLHDSIDLMELWLPGPNVLITLPYESSTGGKYLREETYEGPYEGPYIKLSLTPEVPDNPIPIAMAGVWHDLHTIGNDMAYKTIKQALAQKDVLGYAPGSADMAEEIVGAKNLDVVAMEDPKSAQMFSFGGQNPRNEAMVAQLLQWFDQFSGNTSMLAGTNMNTQVATVANILSQNSATGVTYMKDQVYAATQDIHRKIAWYLHSDPLIQLPLVQRETIPAEYDITDSDIKMISPAQVQETQVFLTPEVRRGDFLDFAFSIEHDSMAPINWQFRLQQLEVLMIKFFPAMASAAAISAQMGTPFSFQKAIVRVAKMMNIEWIDEIFQSPELVAMMAAIAKQGPQAQDSKGVASLAATQQNKGAVTQKTSPSPQKSQRQEAQSGANQGQANLPVRSQ